MKLNPVSLNVPGAKCCAHKNGMTAVVSETDSVYLYEGKSGKSLRTLASNPKTGQAIYVDAERTWHLSIRDLEEKGETKQIYEKGVQLLAAAHYSSQQQEDRSAYEWLQSLWNRPAVDRKELKSGHCLVACIFETVDESHKMRADCGMLGDCISYDMISGDPLIFQLQRDSDLGYGVRLFEIEGRQICALPYVEEQKSMGVYLSRVVQLTREEASWLRQLFLSMFPAQRFLNVHNQMLKEVEAQREERLRKIRRSVIRAGGSISPVGNVPI